MIINSMITNEREKKKTTKNTEGLMHQAWLWDIRPGVGFGKFWARAAFWEERVDRDVVRVIFFFFPLLFISTLKITLIPCVVSLGESFPNSPSLPPF